MSRKLTSRFGLIAGLALIFTFTMIRPIPAEDRDVSGRWTLNVETPQGKADPSVNFRQDGEKLSGTYIGRLGESPVEGSVNGDTIQFIVKLKFRDQDFTVRYMGRIGDDTMEGTVQFGDSGAGTWSAHRRR